MKFIRRDILYPCHFLLNLSLSQLVIVLSDYFCFHILFLLFFGETSPVELSIATDVLFTSLYIGEIHGDIFLGVLHLLLFIRFLLVAILFVLLDIVFEVVKCLFEFL